MTESKNPSSEMRFKKELGASEFIELVKSIVRGHPQLKILTMVVEDPEGKSSYRAIKKVERS